MSTERLKLENDLCRCCLAEGTFQSLSEPQIVSGEQIVYSKMLLHSLSIDILPVAGPHSESTYKICDSCSLRLRDATNFKQQVMLCEERFKNMYDDILKDLEVKQESSGIIDLTECIKEEMSPLEDDMDPDFDNTDFGFTDEGTGAAIDDDDKSMLQIMLENKQKKSKCKAKTKKAVKKPKKPAKKKKAEEAESEGAEPKKDADLPYEVTEIDGTDRLSCTLCHRVFKTKEILSRHFKYVHLKLYPTARACHICKEMVPPSLKPEHMEKYHGVPQPFCTICDRKFSYPNQLLRHQKIVHMGEKNYPCNICHVRFPTESKLLIHNVKHTNVRKYECEFCAKSFKWKKNLKTHLMIHLNIKTKVCTVCDEAFVQDSSLKYHIAKRHPDKV